MVEEGEISVYVCMCRTTNISIASWLRSLRRLLVSQPVRCVLTARVELDQDVHQVGGEEGEVAGGRRDDVPLAAGPT